MALLRGRHDRFCREGSAYTDGLDQAGFKASALNYDATLRNLELIGEAATHIPEGIRLANALAQYALRKR
jgi:uncharacterized protein with HEPN domain